MDGGANDPKTAGPRRHQLRRRCVLCHFCHQLWTSSPFLEDQSIPKRTQSSPLLNLWWRIRLQAGLTHGLSWGKDMVNIRKDRIRHKLNGSPGQSFPLQIARNAQEMVTSSTREMLYECVRPLSLSHRINTYVSEQHCTNTVLSCFIQLAFCWFMLVLSISLNDIEISRHISISLAPSVVVEVLQRLLHEDPEEPVVCNSSETGRLHGLNMSKLYKKLFGFQHLEPSHLLTHKISFESCKWGLDLFFSVWLAFPCVFHWFSFIFLPCPLLSIGFPWFSLFFHCFACIFLTFPWFSIRFSLVVFVFPLVLLRFRFP